MPEIRFFETRNIREVWKREDRDFTPWLSEPEPLARLFAACGLDAEVETEVETEVRIPGVGRSLDILVKFENGHRVAVENQYDDGDHDHLTRALAYAVGLEAQTIIVIAENHRPEFVNVVNYLNAAGLAYEHGIQVFLVEVSVVGLTGIDAVVPVFKVVAAPNEWKAAASIGEKSDYTEKNASLYNFHDQILPVLREKTGIFVNVRPTANPWKSGSPGIGGVTVTYGANKDWTYVQIWFFKSGSPDASKAAYLALKKYEAEVSKKLSEYTVDWRENASTCIAEVVVEGIGYATDLEMNKMLEVADVARRMTEIVRGHKAEIVAAMNEVARKQ